MRTGEQLSMFDIVLEAPEPEQKAEEIVPPPISREKPIIIEETHPLDNVQIPTLNDVFKKLERAAYRVDRYRLLSDVFECGAIAISNRFDLPQAPEREKRYVQIMKAYQPDEQKLICDIFTDLFLILTSVTSKNGQFRDWLGELYMQSGTSSDKNGQFFTPYDVSKMCAKITINGGIVEERKKTGEILSLSEPACGSGGMVLAAMDVLWNDFGFNYANQCFVEACDIDSRCVHMCYLQLSLAGVPAIIKQQDTISRKLWSVWKTPAYIMNWLKFREFESCAHI